MNQLVKSGLGISVIGMGFGLPYITILGLEFASIQSSLLLIIQMGLILSGLGLVIGVNE